MRKIVTVATALSLCACGDRTIGSPAEDSTSTVSQAVLGNPPKVEETSFPGVVMIIAKLNEETGAFGNCGGVMLAPRWVLTAGHCLEKEGSEELNDEDDDGNGTLDNIRVQIIPVVYEKNGENEKFQPVQNDEVDEGQTVAVEAIFTYSSVDDIGLIKLKSAWPVGIDVPPVTTAMPFPNLYDKPNDTLVKEEGKEVPTLRLVGYGGRCDYQKTPEQMLEWWDCDLYGTAQAQAIVEVSEYNDTIFKSAYEVGANPFFSESGSPIFYKTPGGRWVVVGVHVRQHGGSDESDYFTHTSVYPYRDWIEETINDNDAIPFCFPRVEDLNDDFFAAYAEHDLYLNDRVKVLGDEDTPGRESCIAAGGYVPDDGQVIVGTDAAVQYIYSYQDILLRNRADVDGVTIMPEATVTQQDPSDPSPFIYHFAQNGSESLNHVILSSHSWYPWDEQSGAQDVIVNNNISPLYQSPDIANVMFYELDPGAYANVEVHSGYELRLSPGIYRFGKLTVHAGSRVAHHEKANRPVIVHVREYFNWQGTSLGNPRLISYIVPEGNVTSGFNGSIHAYKAGGKLSMASADHYGRYSGYNIEFHQDARIHHEPLDCRYHAREAWLGPLPSCIPTTCEAHSAVCGTMSNGCGATLDCGSCSGGDICNDSNQCLPSAPPVVSAGTDNSITLPATASITGTASDDGRPNPTLSLSWSKTTGPASVTFSPANALTTVVSFSAPGTYVLRLTANDGSLSTSDDVQVTVNPAPATNPCAGLCINPTSFTVSGSYQSGNLGTGAVCRETTSAIHGGNCGNFVSPRTLKINGAVKTCNGSNWASVPAARNGGYCVQTTSGNQSYAYFSAF